MNRRGFLGSLLATIVAPFTPRPPLPGPIRGIGSSGMPPAVERLGAINEEPAAITRQAFVPRLYVSPGQRLVQFYEGKLLGFPDGPPATSLED